MQRCNKRNLNIEEKDIKSKDAKARNIIKQALHDKHLDVYVRNAKTAYEMIENFKNILRGKAPYQAFICEDNC